MQIRTAFDWQAPTDSDLAKQRKTRLRKLESLGKTELEVLKKKATRVNSPLWIGAYSEPTNSEKAPR